jgi:hypothetical protein
MTYAKVNDLESQKCAGVLHTKNGSTHAYVVFERYGHNVTFNSMQTKSWEQLFAVI